MQLIELHARAFHQSKQLIGATDSGRFTSRSSLLGLVGPDEVIQRSLIRQITKSLRRSSSAGIRAVKIKAQPNRRREQNSSRSLSN